MMNEQDNIGRKHEKEARANQPISKSDEEALKNLFSVVGTAGGISQEHTDMALKSLLCSLSTGSLLEGDLRYLYECSPGITLRLAAHMNVPVGGLRYCARDGSLTTDKVLDALLGKTSDRMTVER